MHIHMHRPTHNVHTPLFSLSHTHTVSLPAERETPAFPGQLTCRRTECQTETYQLSQPQTCSLRAAVHDGTSAPLVDWLYSFIQLVTL